MTKFMTGNKLNEAIRSILKETGASAAVAFWGKGGELELGDFKRGEYRIVCNLRMGGTNPYVIEKLKRSNVKQSDTLHAKVYVGNERAIVCSANVSANGLGMEGIEQSKWIEAGVEVPASNVSRWFNDLWNNANPIDDSDIRRAKKEWNSRQKFKGPLVSFRDFDPERKELPLLFWVGGDMDWDHNRKSLQTQFDKVNNEVISIVDDSLEVGGPEDAAAMRPGTWIVTWELGSRGYPKRTPKPSWFYAGRLLKKSFKYKGEKEWMDSVARADNAPAPPFSFSEPLVHEAFHQTLSDPKFSDLRSDDYSGSWCTPRRIALGRQFWADCKARYLEMAGVV